MRQRPMACKASHVSQGPVPPGATDLRPSANHPVVLVLALASLVHCWAASADVLAQGKTPNKEAISSTTVAKEAVELPAPVAEMRAAILAAVHTGDIEELRIPIDWNELKPDIAPTSSGDPIAHLKQISGDGEGREILAVLGKILEMPPARTRTGRDLENNMVYVWPYLAETPLDKLTPAQEVDLYRLMTPADSRAMREKKKWTWWRLLIGADGTWHAFKKDD